MGGPTGNSYRTLDRMDGKILPVEGDSIRLKAAMMASEGKALIWFRWWESCNRPNLGMISRRQGFCDQRLKEVIKAELRNYGTESVYSSKRLRLKNCDEKFGFGHVCKNKQLRIMLLEEGVEIEANITEEEEEIQWQGTKVAIVGHKNRIILGEGGQWAWCKGSGSLQQFGILFQVNEQAFFVECRMTTVENGDRDQSTSPDIVVLKEFEDVFTSHQGLPPNRRQDHANHVKGRS
ncbi:hypothetical protein CR513_36831, partial [Mucuna pruriens]